MRRRVLVPVLAVLAITAGGAAFFATTATTTATCTPRPATTTGAGTIGFSVHCSVAIPVASTVTVTRTVTPTPTTTTTTAPPTTAPPVAGFPTPATTGVPAGTVLTPYTSGVIDVDGTVLDGRSIGCLYITASNVTIRNSRITCAGASPTDSGNMAVQQSNYYTPNVSGLTITDSEITRPAGSNGGLDYALQVYGKNVTLTRVNIHNVTSGVHLSSVGPVTITDSYLGGFVNISGVDHDDAVIANGGATNVTLQHNTLEVPIGQTTPIAAYPEGTPNSYWTIDGNLVQGGGYCMYPSYSKGTEQPNNHFTVTNNVFGRQFFAECGAAGPVNSGPNGALFLDGIGNVWSGNTWGRGDAATSSHAVGDIVNP